MLSVRDGEAKKKDWANTPLVELVRGNALDSFYTLRAFNKLVPLIQDLGSYKVSELLYVPLTTDFAEVEKEGMIVDLSIVGTVGRKISSTLMDLEDVIYAFEKVKKKDNLSSTDDLKRILYCDETGYGLYASKYTDTDQPSTDAETLKELLTLIEDELDSRG